jgi:uncharacterized low-complexity protein
VENDTLLMSLSENPMSEQEKNTQSRREFLTRGVTAFAYAAPVVAALTADHSAIAGEGKGHGKMGEGKMGEGKMGQGKMGQGKMGEGKMGSGKKG